MVIVQHCECAKYQPEAYFKNCYFYVMMISPQFFFLKKPKLKIFLAVLLEQKLEAYSHTGLCFKAGSQLHCKENSNLTHKNLLSGVGCLLLMHKSLLRSSISA